MVRFRKLDGFGKNIDLIFIMVANMYMYIMNIKYSINEYKIF